VPDATTTTAIQYRQSQTYDLFRFVGSSFVSQGAVETLDTIQDTGRPARSANFVMADMNGDGLVDLLSDDRPDTTPGMWLRLGNSSLAAFFSGGTEVMGPSFGSSTFEPARGQEKFLLDVNGNGSAEIVGRARGSILGSSDRALDEFSTTLVAGSLLPGGTAWDTHAHASSIEETALASAFGMGCSNTATSGRSYLGRVFADLDGDGLKDSVAFPLWDSDKCATPRDWRALLFTSVNLGGVFAPAFGQAVPPRSSVPAQPESSLSGRVGPSMVAESGTSTSIPNPLVGEERIPLGDRALPNRTIDNGLRVVDVDGDGLEDILNVGRLNLPGFEIRDREMSVILSSGMAIGGGVAFDSIPVSLGLPGAIGLG
jgi:hypothetical protein